MSSRSTQGYSRPSNSIINSSRIENPQELLSELAALGVQVEREQRDGRWRLVIRGAESALTDALLTRVRTNRAQLRDWLRSQQATREADRTWAQLRGLEVPAEAPAEQPDPEITVTI